MISYTPSEELSVPPLAVAEKQWITRLQRTLAACPTRLELVTTGDTSLAIVDGDGALLSEIADGAAERDGIVLARIPGGPTVHGVSG